MAAKISIRAWAAWLARVYRTRDVIARLALTELSHLRHGTLFWASNFHRDFWKAAVFRGSKGVGIVGSALPSH